jgi:hypothetical protein
MVVMTFSIQPAFIAGVRPHLLNALAATVKRFTGGTPIDIFVMAITGRAVRRYGSVLCSTSGQADWSPWTGRGSPLASPCGPGAHLSGMSPDTLSPMAAAKLSISGEFRLAPEWLLGAPGCKPELGARLFRELSSPALSPSGPQT